MKTTLTKELPLIAIVALPFIYMAIIWSDLPTEVPLHWNFKGEIDRYGTKKELLMIPFVMPLLTYLIFAIIPFIDPKKKLQGMGNKYFTLKFWLTTFMSGLALFILYSTKEEKIADTKFIFIGIGLLFMILGNYFKTIKANYFIGIRTPWTLESEEVWKETHKSAGKLWFGGGLIIMVMGFILPAQYVGYAFIGIVAILSLVPIIHSYLLFKKLDNEKN